jgi:hypothetical protein
LVSYESLLVGDPVLDNGVPRTRIQDGVLVVERGPSLVSNRASEGDAVGLARKSRLMEILTGEHLMVGGGSDPTTDPRVLFPDPAGGTAPDHTTMLNKAEKRLLAEWIDLGGQYYNDPNVSGVATISTLSSATFDQSVFPILQKTCATCHQPGGSGTGTTPTSFVNNRFVLTGSLEGDFNAALAMVGNVCDPTAPSNYLLVRPSGTTPHPANVLGAAFLPIGSPDYNTIKGWIDSGRIASGCP